MGSTDSIVHHLRWGTQRVCKRIELVNTRTRCSGIVSMPATWRRTDSSGQDGEES